MTNEMGSLNRQAISGLDESWMKQGACRPPAADPSMFWPPGDLRPGRLSPQERRAIKDREETAKALCRTCPVQVECLNHARILRPAGGIWGGVKFDEPTGRRAGWRKRQTEVVVSGDLSEGSSLL